METNNPPLNNAKNSPKKSKFKRFLVYLILTLLLSGTGYYFISGMTYSEGTRSGVLTKVTKKGFIFKTYEGEMNIGGIDQGDGTIMPQNVFKFSIEDEATYKKLENLQGKKIVVNYNQVVHNFFWQGDTDYFIFNVKAVTR